MVAIRIVYACVEMTVTLFQLRSKIDIVGIGIEEDVGAEIVILWG